MRLIDIGAATGPGDDEPIAEVIEGLRGRFGFEHVAYAGVNPLAETIHGHVTYPPGWQAHYAERRLHLRDPALLRVARSIAPVDWSRLAADPAQAEIAREGRDFGIPERGLTLPVRGPLGDVGLLSVSSDVEPGEWARMSASALPGLQSAAVAIHDRVMALDETTRVLGAPSLSSRETEVMQWTAAGKSQADVGDILSISVRTVEVHLASSRRKLAALTTPQAVGRAIAMGLIHPQ